MKFKRWNHSLNIHPLNRRARSSRCVIGCKISPANRQRSVLLSMWRVCLWLGCVVEHPARSCAFVTFAWNAEPLSLCSDFLAANVKVWCWARRSCTSHCFLTSAVKDSWRVFWYREHSPLARSVSLQTTLTSPPRITPHPLCCELLFNPCSVTYF